MDIIDNESEIFLYSKIKNILSPHNPIINTPVYKNITRDQYKDVNSLKGNSKSIFINAISYDFPRRHIKLEMEYTVIGEINYELT